MTLSSPKQLILFVALSIGLLNSISCSAKQDVNIFIADLQEWRKTINLNADFRRGRDLEYAELYKTYGPLHPNDPKYKVYKEHEKKWGSKMQQLPSVFEARKKCRKNRYNSIIRKLSKGVDNNDFNSRNCYMELIKLKEDISSEAHKQMQQSNMLHLQMEKASKNINNLLEKKYSEKVRSYMGSSNNFPKWYIERMGDEFYKVKANASYSYYIYCNLTEMLKCLKKIDVTKNVHPELTEKGYMEYLKIKEAKANFIKDYVKDLFRYYLEYHNFL